MGIVFDTMLDEDQQLAVFEMMQMPAFYKAVDATIAYVLSRTDKNSDEHIEGFCAILTGNIYEFFYIKHYQFDNDLKPDDISDDVINVASSKAGDFIDNTEHFIIELACIYQKRGLDLKLFLDNDKDQIELVQMLIQELMSNVIIGIYGSDRVDALKNKMIDVIEKTIGLGE